MKKAIKLFVLFMMAGSVVFTACTKDEDDPQPVQKPVIDLVDSTGYISADATVEIDSVFKVIVYVAENPDSKKNIATLRVIRTFNNIPNTSDIPVNQSSAYIEIEFTAAGVVGEENIQFTAIDNDGQSSSTSIKITTVDPPAAISFYDDVVLGSFNDTEPSFVNTQSGATYSIAEGSQNQNMVDLCFFKSTLGDNINYIAATDDDKAQAVFDFAAHNWIIFNPTRLNTSTVTPAEFDAMTDDTFIRDIEIPDPQDDFSRIEAEVDKVYSFITANGKKGLIKINDLYARGDRANIDIKVQVTN